MTDTTHPARRLRHGQRPDKPLEFDGDLHPDYLRAVSEESPIAAHVVETMVAAASTVLTDERIAEIGLKLNIQAFRDHAFRARNNASMTVSEKEAFNKEITFAREVAAQAGQVAVPEDMTAAADFIDKRAEQYLQDNADTESDTGAVVFHYGEAGREYHSVLVELADDLRQASKPAACSVPRAGWNCTRTAGHEGPCAAAPSPAKESK